MEEDDDLGSFGVILKMFGVIAGIRSCSSYKGDIEILDKKIGHCSKCNTLNSSLEIYRRVTKREHRFSTITHSSNLRIHCMKCGYRTFLLATQQQQRARQQEQENETAVTADESKMSGSEKEESAESCVLSSSFEHGAKDNSESLFSDLSNAIEKEDREKKEKKPLVSHLEIV